MDYTKVIVPKQWGYEYPIYQSPKCEVWLLYLNKGEETSTHQHPNKKTALAVVGGCVKVHLLSTTFSLLPSEKINIRPGVFHRTECWSAQGAFVIELESPPDKTNLVRMRDKYGRAGKPYESEVVTRYDFSDNLALGKEIKIGECCLTIFKTHSLMPPVTSDECHSLFILDGQLESNGFPVIGIGDATDPKTLAHLVEEFGYRELTLLGIRRC